MLICWYGFVQSNISWLQIILNYKPKHFWHYLRETSSIDEIVTKVSGPEISRGWSIVFNKAESQWSSWFLGWFREKWYLISSCPIYWRDHAQLVNIWNAVENYHPFCLCNHLFFDVPLSNPILKHYRRKNKNIRPVISAKKNLYEWIQNVYTLTLMWGWCFVEKAYL